MKLIIDADACPVVTIAVRLAHAYSVPCILVCDTCHSLQLEGAQTVTVDKGADSADYKITALLQKDDIVITQDYGLAALCLAKKAYAVNQNGMEYTDKNIERLLYTRYVGKKIRMAGGRTKGPAKRTQEQDRAFEHTLNAMLQRVTAAEK